MKTAPLYIAFTTVQYPCFTQNEIDLFNSDWSDWVNQNNLAENETEYLHHLEHFTELLEDIGERFTMYHPDK